MLRQRHFLDTHKAATPFVVLGLIGYYSQWENTTAWIYLALHGSYGLLWLVKSNLFPDKSWEKEIHWTGGIGLLLVVGMYWVSPWIITSHAVQAPAWYLGLCVGLTVCGVFYMFVSDMQKHTYLTLRPNQLITEGLWSNCRNPNYFGEFLIYAGLSLLAMHWLAMLVMAIFVTTWIPNMRKKDKSLSRHAGFEDYKKRSKIWIPFLI